jgi:hypothetical protein
MYVRANTGLDRREAPFFAGSPPNEHLKPDA